MDLISKKELLETTGISYGQLYRWKREKLIPEEWFIKQSAYTGQETFFPRALVLGRIQSILEAKGEYSLEELAGMFSPEHTGSRLARSRLAEIAELPADFLPLIAKDYDREAYTFFEVVLLILVAKARAALDLSREAQADLLAKAATVADMLTTTEATCTVFQCDGQVHLAFARDVMPILFDATIAARAVYPLAETADLVKLQYGSLFESEALG